MEEQRTWRRLLHRAGLFLRGELEAMELEEEAGMVDLRRHHLHRRPTSCSSYLRTPWLCSSSSRRPRRRRGDLPCPPSIELDAPPRVDSAGEEWGRDKGDGCRLGIPSWLLGRGAMAGEPQGR
nr:unnamed protein product [Digitaria exilis]CAB3491611.1 unnamed protein product [Digitaria exilis]